MKRSRAKYHRLFASLFLVGAGLWVLSFVASLAQESGASRKYGVVLEVRGAIGPAISDYFVTELDKANAAGAHVVIVEMDTPGGLDTSMRDMIQAILLRLRRS